MPTGIPSLYASRAAFLGMPTAAERHDLMAQIERLKSRLYMIDDQDWAAEDAERQARLHIARRDEIIGHHMRMRAARHQPTLPLNPQGAA